VLVFLAAGLVLLPAGFEAGFLRAGFELALVGLVVLLPVDFAGAFTPAGFVLGLLADLPVALSEGVLLTRVAAFAAGFSLTVGFCAFPAGFFSAAGVNLAAV